MIARVRRSSQTRSSAVATLVHPLFHADHDPGLALLCPWHMQKPRVSKAFVFEGDDLIILQRMKISPATASAYCRQDNDVCTCRKG